MNIWPGFLFFCIELLINNHLFNLENLVIGLHSTSHE